MKRLLITPLLLMLTSCGYGSLYEAKQACSAWEENGPSSTNDSGYTYKTRNCKVEEKTKQVLGLKRYKGKVLKRFSY